MRETIDVEPLTFGLYISALTIAPDDFFIFQVFLTELQHLYTPELRKVSNTITDIAGATNIIRQGGDIESTKTKNAWISHVKVYAHQNDISFCDAMKNADCKSSYRDK